MITTDPPSLNSRRALHNTVILLDGSLLAVGGIVPYGSPNTGTPDPNDCISHCVANYYPERLRTEEIFGETSAEQWDVLAPQAHKRSYHGVALLLPDGSVVSGGGFDRDDLALNSEHSIEVFSPPYMHSTTARPSIILDTLNPPPEPIPPKDYNAIVEFDVLCDPTTAPLRVALLRPGSVTHATDAGQRYVELALASAPSLVTGRKWHLRAWMPIDAYYAPPGYYMLTVIDDEQIPSVAAWIQLVEL